MDRSDENERRSDLRNFSEYYVRSSLASISIESIQQLLQAIFILDLNTNLAMNRHLQFIAVRILLYNIAIKIFFCIVLVFKTVKYIFM